MMSHNERINVRKQSSTYDNDLINNMLISSRTVSVDLHKKIK